MPIAIALKRGIILIISCLLLSFGCSRSGGEYKQESGRIDYRITYLESNLDKKTQDLLPTRMKLLFNKDHSLNAIEGFMGFYRLNTVTNFHSRKCTTVLKVFDKHYLFKGNRDEMMCCFDQMEGLEIEKTGNQKEVAGIACEEAWAFNPVTGKGFQIYYTMDFDIKKPNATNPYRAVPGVLMEFELNLLDLRMRFTAESFQAASGKDHLTALPDRFRQVTRDQMVHLMKKLME